MQALGGLHLVRGDRGAGGPAGLQGGEDRLHQRSLCGALAVPASGFLLQGGQAAFQAVEVGQHQLGLDRLGVADWVDAAFHVGHVPILEAAQHVDDGVHFADVGEELVAEALALARAADEPSDVDELDRRRDDLVGVHDRIERFQAWIRHHYDADVRLDRTERIVRGLRLRRRERVE